LAKAPKSAAQGAQKWAQNLSASTTSIQAGVNAVQTAPGQAAAEHQALMKAKLNAAIDSGKWAARVSSVTTAEWKQAMLTKGLPRVASGAQAALPKYQSFANDFYPVAAQVSQEVSQMPKNSIEDSLARVRVAITRFSDFGKNRK
jgi:hypothetical protein